MRAEDLANSSRPSLPLARILGATSAYVAKNMKQVGVVTGILYIDILEQEMLGSSIVIDGEILRQGETINVILAEVL